MKSTLIAIKSCWPYHQRRDACRRTWVPGVSAWADCVFFVGGHDRVMNPRVGWPGLRTESLYGEPDVLAYEIKDDFRNIAPKVQRTMDYAVSNQYEKVVVCDDDAYLFSGRLRWEVTTCQDHEYVGFLRTGPNGYGDEPYMQGSCYIAGRHAVATLAGSQGFLTNGIPDDVAVGLALKGVVDFVHRGTFYPGPVPVVYPDTVSTHKCVPAKMFEIHEAYCGK